MSKDIDSNEVSHSSKLKPTGPWKRFWQLVSEPWTFILLLASICLFAIGQQKLEPSVTALVQILLAVSSGVLGARVTNLLESASGKSILEARGKVAVRGLKLMLVQTTAFQRRVQRFINNRNHIETNPDVTVRNLEEVIEFCQRIQEEAASAMETWGDVVPTADLSSLIGRITEVEDQLDASRRDLEQAKDELRNAEEDSLRSQAMRERIEVLELQEQRSTERLKVLTERLENQSATSNNQRTMLEALRANERRLEAEYPRYSKEAIKKLAAAGVLKLGGVGSLYDAFLPSEMKKPGKIDSDATK